LSWSFLIFPGSWRGIRWKETWIRKLQEV